MMDKANRIGAGCWYRLADNPMVEAGKWRLGTLRSWGEDYDEFESGPGMFPVGVIEDDVSGLCSSVYVSRICFSAMPPGPVLK